VLVRDLALERWPSMDRYADALSGRIPGAIVPDMWSMAGPRYLTRYWRYPRALRRWHGDLVHVLDHSYAHCLSAFPATPSVVTVHDLFLLRVLADGERTFRARVRDLFLRRVAHWIRRADRVIVSTQWAADDARRALGMPATQTRVVSYGVDARFAAALPAEVVGARRREWIEHCRTDEQRTRVILHVGSCVPRKNVEAALGAIARLRAGGVEAVLVQIGGTFSAAQHALAQRLGLAGVVVQERAVPEERLIAAYAAADLLLLPSAFEGFGLPAVEAMAAGLPVITSGAGGIREAVGDAAVITGVLGAESFAEAAAGVLADDARRADLIARGRARAAGLTWDRAAEATRAVYAELVAS
jgi:glycosyltransferase involved in cell wall biosynthesis